MVFGTTSKAAAGKWSTKKWVTLPASTPYRYKTPLAVRVDLILNLDNTLYSTKLNVKSADVARKTRCCALPREML